MPQKIYTYHLSGIDCRGAAAQMIHADSDAEALVKAGKLVTTSEIAVYEGDRLVGRLMPDGRAEHRP